ncbi:hypothetical protein ABK040_007767 [Willaertia magna]
MYRNILVWFRNDLRIHDNEALLTAIKNLSNNNNKSNKSKGTITTNITNNFILPFYCFDKRMFEFSKIGNFRKTGIKRTKFLMESILNLQNNLKKQFNCPLIIQHGYPEDIIPNLVKEFNISHIYVHKEVTSEEILVENNLERNLQLKFNEMPKIKYFWGHTLIHKDDLPFEVKDMPNVFTQFRTKVESNWKVRECISIPKQVIFKDFPKINEEKYCKIPNYTELGFTKEEEQEELIEDERSVMKFIGGEDEALKQIQNYLWNKDLLKTYKETRNGLIGSDYSSKISPWLSIGCLSPRFIYFEIKRYEKERISNQSTYWLIFEMLWRDFFRFFGEKFGNNLFKLSGISHLFLKNTTNNNNYNKEHWRLDKELIDKWIDGLTGYPFVDANMIELKRTGWMSNRGRQNVASFLTKDLKIDWRIGAEYFESKLLDYDVTSNWGNWLYCAGVGSDPREDRYFNVIKQGYDYDFEGCFVKLWIPTLCKVPQQFIHAPFLMSLKEQQNAQCVVGKDYCGPVVETKGFKGGNDMKNYKHKMKGNWNERVRK